RRLTVRTSSTLYTLAPLLCRLPVLVTVKAPVGALTVTRTIWVGRQGPLTELGKAAGEDPLVAPPQERPGQHGRQLHRPGAGAHVPLDVDRRSGRRRRQVQGRPSLEVTGDGRRQPLAGHDVVEQELDAH